MKRLRLLLVALAMLSCPGYGQSAAEKPDSIEILSLSSDRPVRPGVEVEFSMSVAYDLTSAERAMIGLGFNGDKPEGFRIVETRLVQRGPGTVTFVVKAVPVDWGDEGQFSVCAVLETYPPGRSSTTLASHIVPIEFEE